MTDNIPCCEKSLKICDKKSEEIKDLANVFKILSDPIRLKIIYILRDGELCVCEITTALNMSQPKISYHLKILADCGLINRRTDWVWAHYSITDNLEAWLDKNGNLLKLLEEE